MCIGPRPGLQRSLENDEGTLICLTRYLILLLCCEICTIRWAAFVFLSFFCNFHLLPFLFLGIGIVSFKCCSGNWCQSPILFYIFVLRKPCPLLKTVYILLQNVSLSNSFLVSWLGRHGENSAFVVSVACIQDFLLTVLFEVHVLLRITHVVWWFLRCWWQISTRISVWEHLYVCIILSLQLSDACGEVRFDSVVAFRFYQQDTPPKTNLWRTEN